MNDTVVTPFEEFRDKYRRKSAVHSDVAGPGAQIWQCVEKSTKKNRSMKVIQKDKCSRFKFLQEVTILKECNGHPNLLDVQDVYECEKYYYIVTDDVDHPTVMESLTALKKLNTAEVGAVIRNLVNTLLYLHDPNATSKTHKKEIIHGNINTKTLLVPQGASPKYFLLVDFSSAYMDLEVDNSDSINNVDIDTSDSSDSDKEEEHPAPKKKKQARRRKKKSQFHPPEYEETGPSIKGDMWALGVLSFLLLTGRYPFKRPSEVQAGIQNWYNIKSPKIRDFLQLLLEYHSEDRPTAAVINQDRDWETNFEGYEDDLKDVMGRLSSINKEYGFKKAVRSYIAANLLKESNQERLARIFRLADANNDNSFSKKEFQHALEEADIDISPKELDNYFCLLDVNGDKKISYTEFMAFAEKEEILFEKNKLKAAFDAFDFSNTGYITAEDLKNFSASAGGASTFRGEKVLKNRTIRDMMEEADKNGDGKISFEEFSDLILKKPYFAVFSW